MSNTTLYSGPLTLALNGADLSAIVGPLVGGGLYALLWHTMAPFSDPALRPGGAAGASNTRRHPRAIHHHTGGDIA